MKKTSFWILEYLSNINHVMLSKYVEQRMRRFTYYGSFRFLHASTVCKTFGITGGVPNSISFLRSLHTSVREYFLWYCSNRDLCYIKISATLSGFSSIYYICWTFWHFVDLQMCVDENTATQLLYLLQHKSLFVSVFVITINIQNKKWYLYHIIVWRVTFEEYDNLTVSL